MEELDPNELDDRIEKLLKSWSEPKKHPTKTGPDPTLEYDIDWYEGPHNSHAEYNKNNRLRGEAKEKAHSDILKNGFKLEELTHPDWEIVNYRDYDGEKKKCLEILEWFKDLGYTRIFEMNSIYDFIVAKPGEKYVPAIIIMKGEYDNSGRTIYPGIQLTETLIEEVEEGESCIHIQDCLKGVSSYNGGEDYYYSGNTHRWGFDNPDKNLKEFVEYFKTTLSETIE